MSRKHFINAVANRMRQLDKLFKINLKRRYSHGNKTDLQRIGRMLLIFHWMPSSKQSLISFPLQFNTLKLLALDLFLVIMRLQQKILETRAGSYRAKSR
jgi:hypothetical protein